jgi:hypothetical protein
VANPSTLASSFHKHPKILSVNSLPRPRALLLFLTHNLNPQKMDERKGKKMNNNNTLISPKTLKIKEITLTTSRDEKNNN